MSRAQRDEWQFGRLWARIKVGIDLTIVFALIVGTFLFSAMSVTESTPVLLHLLVSAMLNGAVIGCAMFYLYQRAGSW